MAGRNVDFVNTIPGRCALSVNDPNSPAPRGWAWIKLTEIARLESGHTPSRNHPEYWDGDIAWIGIKDAREHHAGVIDDTLQHVTQAGIDNSAARLLPAKTVCLSRTASVGYVVVMGRPMATSQDFVNWVCTPALDPDYLKWLLLAEGGDGLRKFGKGSTHTTIYFPEVQAFHACVAPLNEQRRIVAKLDTIFEQTRTAKARFERLPALLEKLKRSILAAAFRGDLTKNWRAANRDVEHLDVALDRARAELAARPKIRQGGRNVDTVTTIEGRCALAINRGPAELPETWRWCPLSDVSLLESGHTPSRSNSSYWGGAFGWIGITDARDYHGRTIERTEETITQEGLNNSAARLLPAGTVCVSRTASIGYVVVMGTEMATSQDFANWVCTSAIEPRFLAYAFLAEDSEGLRRFGKGTTHTTIYYPELKALHIRLPPVAEQREIVRLLDMAMTSLEPILARASQVLSRIEDVRRAALSMAFRGGLVPQDPNDEPAAVLLERIRATRKTEPTAQRRGRADRSTASKSAFAMSTNGHAMAQREDPLDLVIAAFQQDEPRLGMAAIAQATGLDAA
ncbi:MAG TPA: restriction endonuclease subunit S, partial [Sphingomicrobium sp.]|nr:restriction endonuclease subunit S [Sphingomicrobium sp.]